MPRKALGCLTLLTFHPKAKKGKKKKKKHVRKDRQKDTLTRRTVLQCSFHSMSRNKLLIVTTEQVLIIIV